MGRMYIVLLERLLIGTIIIKQFARSEIKEDWVFAAAE
jgi:hypothetical protein